jgi:hypothetical protein
MTGQPLSRLQHDILELESMTWREEGAKMKAFRERHERVTETAYYVALGRLLENPLAYEYDNGRYAAMLNRLSRTADQAAIRRGHFRPGATR